MSDLNDVLDRVNRYDSPHCPECGCELHLARALFRGRRRHESGWGWQCMGPDTNGPFHYWRKLTDREHDTLFEFREGCPAMSRCTCPQIYAGLRPTGSRNWNYKCPEHGTDSDWYNSPGQVEKRDRQNERLRDLQLQAKAARSQK